MTLVKGTLLVNQKYLEFKNVLLHKNVFQQYTLLFDTESTTLVCALLHHLCSLHQTFTAA